MLQESGCKPTFVLFILSHFPVERFPVHFISVHSRAFFFLLACGVLFYCFAFHCIGRSFFIASGALVVLVRGIGFISGFVLETQIVFRAAGINAVVSMNSFFPSLSLLFASLPLYSCIVLFSFFHRHCLFALYTATRTKHSTSPHMHFEIKEGLK